MFTATAVAFTVLAWASGFVGIRAAADELSPGPLTLFRLAAAAVALTAMVAVRRERFPSRSVWIPTVAVGSLWFGVYNVALNAAERDVDAGTAALLVNIGPILIALIAGRWLGEGLPRALVLGCGVSFAGVLLIALSGGSGIEVSTGALLCLLAAASYAVAVVLQKSALAAASSLSLIWACCLVGLAITTPFAPALFDEVRHASASAVAWTVYLGLVPTALAFTTWAYALARTPAGRLGAVTYVVPPLVILLGWLILGERPPWLAVVGGAVALAGVAISRR